MRRLLDAAMIAFDQRGYYDTRINDVVKIAKTSHGTFYLYFSNKEDLLRALVTEAGAQAQNLADALDRPPELGGTPQWSDVRGWIAAYSDHWIRYRPALPGLDRPGHDRSVPPRDPAPDADPDVRRPGASDRVGRVGQQPRPAHRRPGGRGHVGSLPHMREFVGQPVDEVALDTLATMIHRSLFA
jgi:AcrR family transcriptional regulator